MEEDLRADLIQYAETFPEGHILRDIAIRTAQELSKENPPVQQSTVISLPTPKPTLAPIDGSSDLLNEASNLQMRDYSTLFEELKKINQ